MGDAGGPEEAFLGSVRCVGQRVRERRAVGPKLRSCWDIRPEGTRLLVRTKRTSGHGRHGRHGCHMSNTSSWGMLGIRLWPEGVTVRTGAVGSGGRPGGVTRFRVGDRTGPECSGQVDGYVGSRDERRVLEGSTGRGRSWRESSRPREQTRPLGALLPPFGRSIREPSTEKAACQHSAGSRRLPRSFLTLLGKRLGPSVGLTLGLRVTLEREHRQTLFEQALPWLDGRW